MGHCGPEQPACESFASQLISRTLPGRHTSPTGQLHTFLAQGGYSLQPQATACWAEPLQSCVPVFALV